MNAAASENQNRFLTVPIPALFFQTAAPIVIIMLASGLYNIVDAWFLGEFVGADALTAVTLMFPIQMAFFAISTMISSGMSSMLARRIGAADKAGTNSCYTVAHLLGAVMSAFVIGVFLLIGHELVISVANGAENIASAGYDYIIILVIAFPVLLALGLHLDVLRAEGALKIMTMVTLSSTVLNIIFNYVFIAELSMGVKGSAYGTVAAQSLCLAGIFLYYRWISHALSLRAVAAKTMIADMREMISLGLPSSLNFLGSSLITFTAIFSLQVWPSHDYEATVGAYGIITRITTFLFLPLMGITMAFQTVVGHNYGAKNMARTNETLKLALKVAFVYCVITEVLFLLGANWVGALFVDSTAMISETGRLLPYAIAAFFSFGPSMVIAQFFQAIGDAKKAALLNLSRIYLFQLPLMLTLPFMVGEVGIWSARWVAEIGVILLTVKILYDAAGKTGVRWGLFFKTE